MTSQRSTLIISQRNLKNEPSRASEWEFEDLVESWQAADLISLKPRAGIAPTLRRRANNAVGSALRRSGILDGGNEPHQIGGHYDLVLVACNSIVDLATLNRVSGWREQSDVAVLWLSELWRSQIGSASWNKLRPIIDQFDRVFVPQMGTAELASSASDTTFLPVESGVDTDIFCPNAVGDRHFDVVAVGRRPARLHEELVRATKENNLRYHFDSYAKPRVADGPGHRLAYAQLLRASRNFLCLPARFDDFDTQQGQLEAGSRYVESIAAGAVPVGDIPGDRGAWTRFVKVLQGEPQASELIDLLKPRDNTKDVQAELISTALESMDWAFTWQSMLHEVGMTPSAITLERIDRLKADAASYRRVGARAVPLA